MLVNAKVWWLGADIVDVGWRFYHAKHKRIAYRFFVIGRDIEHVAEKTCLRKPEADE
jgi:hypothetical protein